MTGRLITDWEAREAFGEAVRVRRGELGLSQEETAARADMTKAVVSLIERAAMEPALTDLWRLAFALELEPAELVQRVPLTGRTSKRSDVV